uniref:Protein kinase domain-containing protein n=1 Tax=Ananas comosus var. bracteatus TaxID=296719 RepID=A0A6V7QEA8_ANACO|nr:unnamed protein product [Ananas comosus var. bracteatus]
MGLLVRVFLLSLLLVSSLAQLPSQDILALLAFKKGITHDPTGFIADSWNEESIDFNGCPSSWNGIVCNGANVAGVILDNRGISGIADLSVFANLTMLVKLSMADNNFSGSLPANLAPEGVGKLQSLQNLSLAGNDFSGPLPDSIGGLSSLQSLDLSRNSFSGPLPDFLKSLRSLVSLNLSYNAFTKEIPSGLGMISTLEYVDMSWNQLDGSVDWKFLVESSVIHVDFSGNSLTTANPKELKALAEISETVKYLNLSNNQLSGTLIDGVELSTFGRLKVLDLSNNQLSGDLPGFNYVYDLEVLRLGNNAFTGFVPSGLLKDNTLVLSELDLSANNLSGHINMITSTTLRVLNLSSNAISGNLPLLTGSCTTLDLSSNQFGGNLSVIAKWANDLEYIDLSQNQLTGSFPEVTSQFLRLNYLNLSHNSLTNTIPEIIAQYPKLTVLDLSSNQFSGPILTDLLTSSTLQELYLQNNLLIGAIMFSPSASNRSNLQVLNLSGNRFNGSFPDDLGSLTGLQVLDLSANNFSGTLSPAVTKLISLTSLDISLNHFTGLLPTTLPNTLTFFNASYNDLSGIVPENLRMFPDSSFHPGNSRLEFPGGPPGSGNTPSENFGHKQLKTSIKVAIIAGGIVILLILILLSIICHYKRISRGSGSEKVSDKSAQRKSLPETAGGKGEEAGGGASVVSADDLRASRKGSTSEMITPLNPEEKLAAIGGYSPSKNSRFSWSPESGETYVHESLGKLDVRSPDKLAGSLASFLYDRPGRRGPSLTWAQRLKIAVDVARGLNYLHFDRAIPHGNLKATNILLDGLDLNARVADYCLHRLMTQSGTVEQILDSGVLGYRAPELAASKKPSPSFKSDVYAFGVILLELLTGKCAGDVISGEEGGIDLTDWVRLRVAEGRGSDCFDPVMASDLANSAASKGMKEVLGIALRCIRPISERPGIKSVYEDLSSI